MTRIGSLCTGYGGLDQGVQAVLGGTVTWHAEIDPDASRVLAHHYPDVVNHGDLTAADWSQVEPVDILTAGFPCQPVSMAGRRKGTSDERWLWEHIEAAIGRMDPQPGLLLLENVPGLLTANHGNAFARVIHGLAALGYVGSYRTVRASDVGAPHRRERIFIVARDTHGMARSTRSAQPWGSQPVDEPGTLERTVGSNRTHAPSHPGGQGLEIGPVEHHGPERQAAERGRGEPPAHTPGDGRNQGWAESAGILWGPDAPFGGDVDWGLYGPAIDRWEHATGRPAPAPTEPGSRGRDRLSPRFVEWLMGLPDGWVTAVPGLSRNAKLRILGNGVVPRQSAYALSLLLDREGMAA